MFGLIFIRDIGIYLREKGKEKLKVGEVIIFSGGEKRKREEMGLRVVLGGGFGFGKEGIEN